MQRADQSAGFAQTESGYVDRRRRRSGLSRFWRIAGSAPKRLWRNVLRSQGWRKSFPRGFGSLLRMRKTDILSHGETLSTLEPQGQRRLRRFRSHRRQSSFLVLLHPATSIESKHSGRGNLTRACAFTRFHRQRAIRSNGGCNKQQSKRSDL